MHTLLQSATFSPPPIPVHRGDGMQQMADVQRVDDELMAAYFERVRGAPLRVRTTTCTILNENTGGTPPMTRMTASIGADGRTIDVTTQTVAVMTVMTTTVTTYRDGGATMLRRGERQQPIEA